MSHPYSKHAGHTGRAKMRSMGKSGNLDIPVMRAVGENQAGGIRESSSSMQMKRQAGAAGMKRGGRFGKHKSKTKPDVSALMAAPPSPDMASPPSPVPTAAPGGPPPGPPMPTGGPPPMQKRGGRAKKYERGGAVKVHKGSEAHMKETGGGKGKLKSFGLESGPIKGGEPFAGHVTHGGAQSGIGRLEKTRSGRK
jgi:hypothetical protein